MNTVETFAILGMLSKNAFFLAASCHGKNPIKVWFSSSTHRQYAAFFPAFIFFPALSVAVSLKVRVYNPRLLGCGTFRDLLSLYSTCSLYHYISNRPKSLLKRFLNRKSAKADALRMIDPVRRVRSVADTFYTSTVSKSSVSKLDCHQIISKVLAFL